LDLETYRIEIDKIDDEILDLINKRAELAKKIGQEKKKRSIPVYQPERENEVLRRIKSSNKGPLSDRALEGIYREIISASRALEAMDVPIKIAYLGPEATFTHVAALERFGSSAEYLPVESIEDVFIEVEKKRADFGVVPIENSTEGVINHTLDNFIDSKLKICAEVFLEISHHLLAGSNLSLNKIKEVYSHSQAFAQSKSWLKKHLAHAKLIEVASTAVAAKLAASTPNTAAIASELAAKLYELKILQRRIEDKPDNITRFLVIGLSDSSPSKHDKTSILFSIKDEVGALHQMLLPFAKHKVNLTMIESRPSRRQPWDYIFFLDIEGHIKDKNVEDALRELKEKCMFLKILGSYPAGEGVIKPSIK
jgi:chorismate mutase/prephenate dehydratase